MGRDCTISQGGCTGSDAGPYSTSRCGDYQDSCANIIQADRAEKKAQEQADIEKAYKKRVNAKLEKKSIERYNKVWSALDINKYKK